MLLPSLAPRDDASKRRLSSLASSYSPRPPLSLPFLPPPSSPRSPVMQQQDAAASSSRVFLPSVRVETFDGMVHHLRRRQKTRKTVVDVRALSLPSVLPLLSSSPVEAIPLPTVQRRRAKGHRLTRRRLVPAPPRTWPTCRATPRARYACSTRPSTGSSSRSRTTSRRPRPLPPLTPRARKRGQSSCDLRLRLALCTLSRGLAGADRLTRAAPLPARATRERKASAKGKEAETWDMKMWVDKYRPDKFTNLLGDEVRRLQSSSGLGPGAELGSAC